MTATPARNTIGQYREFSAPKALAPFFDYFWVYEGVEEHNTETFHRVLPDPDSSIRLRARWHAGAPPEAAEVQFQGPIKAKIFLEENVDGVVNTIEQEIRSHDIEKATSS